MCFWLHDDKFLQFCVFVCFCRGSFWFEPFLGCRGQPGVPAVDDAFGASPFVRWEFYFQAIPLILLMTWAFLPLYLTCGVYTLPEYLSRRFGEKHGHKLRVLVSLIFILVTLNCIMPVSIALAFLKPSAELPI